MGKMILRVQKGIHVSANVLASLQNILGNFDQQVFDPHSFDFSIPIQQRIESISTAFDFVIEQQDPALRNDLSQLNQWLLQQFQLKAALPQKQAEPALREYLALLIDALTQSYALSQTEAIDLLNLAEQYCLLQKGRPDQATLSMLPDGSTNQQWVLQVDKRMPALHPDTKAELVCIVKSANPAQIPSAFETLPTFLQLFLLRATHASQEAYQQDLNSLIALSTVLKNLETEEALPRNLHPSHELQPAWFTELPHSLQTFYAAIYDDASANLQQINATLKHYKIALGHFFKNNSDLSFLYQLRQLPFWYCQLSSWEKRFVWSSLQRMDFNQIDEWYFPSRLRSAIPCLANAGTHQVYTVSDTGTIDCLSRPRKRSAHLASRLTRNAPSEIQWLHTSRNLELVQDPTAPTFIGTLISPVPGTDQFLPDRFLQRSLDRNIEFLRMTRGLHIIKTNHAQNIAKEVFYPTNSDLDCNVFLSAAKEKASTFPGTHRVQPLIEEYQALLETTPGWFDLRALYLASLEHLIAHELGFTVHGSCVSGKDRYALLLLFSDSLLLFYQQNQSWPKYNAPSDRSRLRTIFITLLYSQHQQNEANFGAPGAYGIKNIHQYLPSDYQKAMRSWQLDIEAQDQLATLNELGKIRLTHIQPAYSLCLTKALLLSEPQRRLVHQQLQTACPEPLGSGHGTPGNWTAGEGADRSIVDIAQMLNQPEAALYVHWLLRAQELADERISNILNTIHQLTQQNDWPTTRYLSNSLTLGFFNSAADDIPEGIGKIRKILTGFSRSSENPLSFLSQVLFVGYQQYNKSSWGRSDKTQSFYQILKNIFTSSTLAESLPELQTQLNSLKKYSRPPSPSHAISEAQIS
ncbi:MAG: hypothetical protein JJT82_01260 [Legionellaceae bacterium]|nr:hypothetical protein [Legionellaceae bacterium]